MHSNVVVVIVCIIVGIVFVVLSKNMVVDCVVNVDVCVTTDGELSCYCQPTDL